MTTHITGRNRPARPAAPRLPPLQPCGCIRDPLHDRHRCGGELTEQQVDGYRDAVAHLRAAGLTPAALAPELHRMWRRGERKLAVEVAQAWWLAG